MVEFKPSMGGYDVFADTRPFGRIDKTGFFTDSTVVREFTRVSTSDLRAIADKTDEYLRMVKS